MSVILETRELGKRFGGVAAVDAVDSRSRRASCAA